MEFVEVVIGSESSPETIDALTNFASPIGKNTIKVQVDKVNKGELGRQSGKGFYPYK